LTSQGELKKLVDFDKGDPAVLGMAFDNKNKVLFAAQKTNQEVLRITENGAEELLGSAGLTTPIALAINNNGEVFVNGDEVGVLKINLDSGEVSEYKTGLVCFQPPPAGMVFDKDGLLYYTEAAPGFPSRIITVDSSGKISVITQDVGCPAGIAIDNNGEVIYADYQNGAVYKLGKNGLSVTIVAGLSFPVGVVVGRDDAIYVATALPGTKGDPRSLNEPFRGSIIKYTKGSGIKEVYRTDSNLSFFDVDLNGNLYIPDGNRLVVRYVDGRIETIANGFQWVRDAKIAKDGSIYVTDYSASALYRLKREVVN
jgi:sugar lactone lactonase YvrE